jgi:hypothetical protein
VVTISGSPSIQKTGFLFSISGGFKPTTAFFYTDYWK